MNNNKFSFMRSHTSVFKRLIAAMLAVLIVSAAIVCTASASSEDGKGKVVRVGYIDYYGFVNKNSDGTYSGYGVDLLNEICKYTGWTVEYVYDSWSNHLKNLQSGDIDFVCHAQRTDERAEKYIFSEHSSGSEASILYVNTGDDRYYYNDYESFDGMKIAFLKGSFQNSEFDALSERRGFSYTSVYYDTESAAFDALGNGSVDAVAMGSLSAKSGYKVVCRFGSDPFYFMSGKENAELVSDLDSAIGEIFSDNSSFLNELYNQYYVTSDADTDTLFTRDEAEFIKNSGTITVGLVPNRVPLSYTDSSGDAVGLTVDIMNLISEKSGLSFSYKFLGESQTGMDFLSNGGGDLVAGVMSSVFSSPNPTLLQTDSLIDCSIVIVGKTGQTFSRDSSLVVAMPAGFIGGKESVSKAYPNLTFYDCFDNTEALDAISTGKADIMFQDIYVARETLQSPRYENMEIYPAFSYTEKMKAVALPESEVLVSIINKTLDSVTDDERDSLVIKNTIARTYKMSTNDVIYKYKYAIACIILIAVLIVFFGLFLIIQRQKNLLRAKEANCKLADAVNQAQSANTAKSQFLARMSHEIRTPMNAIVGITQIAKKHLGDEEKMNDYLDKIDSSSQVLLNIINDVLDMSAIENDKMKIAHTEFDLKQVLTRLSTVYYTQCKNKGVDFVMSTDIRNETVIGDSLRVNQILLNLLSNAFKFTDEGGKIKVSAREKETKGDVVYIRFTVSDTGCGITEEMLNRLFKPFEQENADTAQKHGGSGLGLSIAKNLVTLMNGAIDVQSEQGKGTTFTVDLPFGTTGHIAEDSNNSEPLKDVKVLVIDDDETARDYTTLILKRIGVKFDIAESGERATEMLTEAFNSGKGYDLCLVDWKMPGMNGLDVSRRIRKMFDNDTIIIIASAYDVSEISDEAEAAGVDMCIPKPLFQSTIFNILMQLSGGKYKNAELPDDSYDFTGHKVLLCEDNELNAEIAVELLGFVNLKVDRAADGKIGLDKFLSSAPGEYGAILMDIQMPVMDGFCSAREIRASDHPDAKTVPIFAMTANAFSSDVSAAISAGMNGHISKPINTNVLYATLKKAIIDKE